MLTGEKKEVGEYVAKKLNMDKVYTELLPDGKVEKVEELLKQKSEKGKLVFVGDGINDAPVLTISDIGVAMGGLGSDAAIEAADIVMKTKIPKTIVPSEIGRYFAYFSSKQVDKIRKTNKTGEFFAEMFEGYKSKYIMDATETNDLSAIMYLIYPEIFTTYKCSISVDLDTMPGKTEIYETPNGNITFVENVNRKEFFKLFMQSLKAIKD